nr:hypothetical protein [Tanacetum cinerariifolium]
MEYWITNNDMNIWKGIKGKNYLLQSIPDDHVADFHNMDDARDIWNAVKARFGGNTESKKIRKSMLKQKFSEFRIEDEDINLKFLRALPSSWSQVALTLKTKGPSHFAFVSTTSASKKMSYGDSPSYSSTTTYTAPSNSKTRSHRFEKLDLEEMDLKWQIAMLSVRVHKFEQKARRKIDFDKKESPRFNKKKVRCYKCQQRGHFARECMAKGGNDKQRYSSFKIKEIGKKEKDSKALITVDTLVGWTDHDGESDEVIASKEFSMIAGCDTEDAITKGVAKIYNLITGADTEEASTAGDTGEFALMGVTFENTSNLLKHSERINANVKTAKKELQINLNNHLVQTKKWRISSKNLFRLIDNSMSIRTKVGLGFNNYIRENELGWDDSAFSVFTTNSKDVEGRPLFNSDKSSEVNTNEFASNDSSVKSSEPKPNDSTSRVLTSSVSTSENEAKIESNVGTPIQEPIIVQDLPSFFCNNYDKNKNTSRSSCNKNGYFNKKAAVLLRTGKVNIYPARSQPVPTGKPKVFASVPTSRQNKPFPVPTDRGYSPSENPFLDAKDERVFDSGCSRSMTETECLVLSKDFKLPDESMVVLRVPRKHNLYTINLNNLCPRDNLACLVAHASVDKSVKWHRRMGKQHKASYKAINVVSSISEPLQLLHIDLFGPTSIRSIDHKYYCLVITDDYSSHFKPFGCHVTILNTSDDLGKFDRKADEGYIVGYSASYKHDKSNQSAGAQEATTNPAGTQDADSDLNCDELVIIVPSYPLHNIQGTEPKDTSGDEVDDSPLTSADKIFQKELARLKVQLTHFFDDDPTTRFPSLSDLRNHDPSPGIFSSSSYDDEFGAALNNVASTVEVDAMQEEMQQFKFQNVWVLVDLPEAQGHKHEEGIDYDEVFTPVARIEAIRLFLAFASYMGFMVYQMDVKSAFLYRRIDKEVYITQPKGFVDPQHPKKVCKFVKALYGLHQAPRAWYATLSTFLLKHGYKRGTIDKTLFLKKNKKDIILQRPDGIFINQDKYVQEILNKFDLGSVRMETTPYEAPKPKSKNESDISACLRNQVTPTTSNLEAVKKIFKYLKGQPKLGLWYPRESPLVLEAYSDSDYARANKDRKSTTGGCQFLGRRLILWKCKKQTIMATSFIEAEYVNAANCCGQDAQSIDAMIEGRTVVVKFSTNLMVQAGGLVIFKCSTWTRDEHNKVGYLLKPTGSDDYHQIIDFLRASHIQSPELGPLAIQATIDETPYTITEDLVRSQLQLDDDGGIDDLPIVEIYSRIDNLGTKSGSWDQFGSSFAVALICLSDGRQFNWSSYIFKGMGHPMPLLAVMLSQDQEVFEHGQSSDPNIASFSRTHEIDDGLFTNIKDKPLGGSFHMSPPRSTPAPPAGQTSGGAEDLITLTALSYVVSTLVQKVNSLQIEVNDHKKLFKDVVGKLVKKVKPMEVKPRTMKRKMVASDSDQEEEGKQDVDLDALLALANAAVIVDSNIPPGGASNNHASSTRVLADVLTSANVPSGSTSVTANVPTSVAPAGVSNKGKTPMVEEDITVKEKTFKQMKDDRLGEQAAKRLHDEEQAQNRSCAIYSTGWSMAYVKSFTDDQLKEEFEKIQKVLSNIQIQAFSRTLKRTGPVLEEPSSKRKKSTEAPIPSVPEVPQSPVVSSPKSSDADDQTFIKVVSNEDSADEAPRLWSALVGLEYYENRPVVGAGLILWGDLQKLKAVYSNVHVLETVCGEVVYMFTDVSYPFSVKLMERMLKHKLEIDKDVVGNDITTLEQLIQFIKNQLSAAQVSPA